MADKTKIEWSDATWNPITGCSVVSPGCTNCYAMRLAGTRLRNHPSREGLTNPSKGGPVWNGQVRFNEQWLDQPLRWRRPRRIFPCAHGDLFHENVPWGWIVRVFDVMEKAGHHQFQPLTKRPSRAREFFSQFPQYANLPNVWLGVSVEDKQRVWRISELLLISVAVRFVSFEPLLGPIWMHGGMPPIDWAIVGGESGPGARDMDPDWARLLRNQCAVGGVAFFMKQMARKAPIPDDLMIREYPKGEGA